MNEIEKICRTMLDNANLNVEFTNYPLTFYVTGTYKKVIFDCSGIREFRFFRDAVDDLDGPEYVCLEVNVEEPNKQMPENRYNFEYEVVDKTKYLWSIEILPDAHIKIKCLHFDWKVLNMMQEEIDERSRRGKLNG